MTDANDLELRAHDIDWLVCDVDGVLTTGHLLYWDPRHETERQEVAPGILEAKSFHVRDGLGLRLAKKAGLRVALLSGRASSAVSYRARELDLDDVILGSGDKKAALQDFLARHQTSAGRTAAIGDDLPDLPLLDAARLSFAPANAAREVREAADVVLETNGGHGCVREMVEWLLRARGEWEALVADLR